MPEGSPSRPLTPTSGNSTMQSCSREANPKLRSLLETVEVDTVVRPAAEDVSIAGRELDGKQAEVVLVARLEVEGLVQLVLPGGVKGRDGTWALSQRTKSGDNGGVRSRASPMIDPLTACSKHERKKPRRVTASLQSRTAATAPKSHPSAHRRLSPATP